MVDAVKAKVSIGRAPVVSIAKVPSGRAPVNPVRRRKRRRQWLPYVLLAPAIVMELLIHIIPMLIGVMMSFFKMTQLYLGNWRQAPFAHLDNYRLAMDFNQPAGKALLHSFVVTIAFTVLVLAFSWSLGLLAAVLTQRPFRGRGIVRTLLLVPFALSSARFSSCRLPCQSSPQSSPGTSWRSATPASSTTYWSISCI